MNRFVAAAEKGDEAALKGLLNEGLVYVHSNGTTVENKAQCIAAILKSKSRFELKPGWTVQMYGDSAVVHGQLVAHNMQAVQRMAPSFLTVKIWLPLKRAEYSYFSSG